MPTAVGHITVTGRPCTIDCPGMLCRAFPYIVSLLFRKVYFCAFITLTFHLLSLRVAVSFCSLVFFLTCTL